jgi:hypothetical protein
MEYAHFFAELGVRCPVVLWHKYVKCMFVLHIFVAIFCGERGREREGGLAENSEARTRIF